MRKQTLNEYFIEAIKHKLPEDIKLVDFISKQINLGKEASYRRLRGDVEFTFSEVVAISANLNLNFESIIGKIADNKSVVETYFIGKKDPHKEYVKTLNQAIDYMKTAASDDRTVVYMICNTLPVELTLRYKQVSKLRFFKWLYQNNLVFNNKFSEIEIPSFVMEAQSNLANLLDQCRIVYIFEENLILSIIRDIKYFSSLNIFSENDKNDLQEELNSFLNDMESLTQSDVNKNNKKVSVYISHVSFESPYIYIESEDRRTIVLKVYSVNTLTSEDPYICNTLKYWIQSIKKYSTLISQSGDIERTNFLRKQRDLMKMAFE